MKKVKVVKKDEQRHDSRIRGDVMRKLLLDEKSRLVRRVNQIDKTVKELQGA